MKPDHLPGAAARLSRSRRALAQPRFLAASMALAVAGCAYLATAQTGSAPVEMRSPSASTSSNKPASLEDLPGMIEAYGLSRQKAAASKGSGAVLMAIGNGQTGYNLVESDLTPSTKSDEREPVYAPGGGTIAYISNGVDANKDGRMDDAINAENKYHVWVMNADGTNQRQITGLNSADKNRNQRHPSWAPTGTEMVYVDGDDTATELYVVRPFASGVLPSSPVATPERRTFFPGNKRSPAWSPTGLNIVFSSNAVLSSDQNAPADQYDLYSVTPAGTQDAEGGVQRLTGGLRDAAGNATDDLNPSFSALNGNILYFSSNRAYNAARTLETLSTGRRIWTLNLSNRVLTQVSEPARRAAGTREDIDDYPSASVSTDLVGERVSFQSNSFIDTSDRDNGGAKDFNIWGLFNTTATGNNFVETEPRLFASNFSGNTVFNKDPILDEGGRSYQNLGFVGLPEGVVVRGQYVYVASSGTGRVLRFDQETGSQALNNFNVPADTIPKASGMIADDRYLYVGSGIGAKDKVAIYRIFLNDGTPDGRTATSAAFSAGEVDAAGVAAPIKDGTEGLAFSTDANRQFIYVSCYTDDKINVYNRSNGNFVKTFTARNETKLPDDTLTNPLDGPTGLAFGPDLNNDTYPDLYVCSSASDDVLAYMGPNPTNPNAKVNGGASDPGTFIRAVVEDNGGVAAGMNAPEGIQFITRTDTGNVDMYVSNFHARDKEGGTGTGNTINRYQINPATQTGTLTRSYLFDGGAGIGYFEFNNLARQSLASGTGGPAPTPVPTNPTIASEGNSTGPAQVITNILSSPANYSASGLGVPGDVVGQDRAADREPAFSRSTATDQLAARVTFASTRLYAPAPSSNATDANGNKAAPSNPYGSNGDGGTHDIWGSAAQDTTPPALIPQGTGNQLYPVIAPGEQAPFDAPRYPVDGVGLVPGGKLEIALVLRDLESGIARNGAVTVSIRQAGVERFTSSTPRVNENIPVTVRREGVSDTIMTVGLQAYDDGPSPGGHERQANAVEGDGIYYCESDDTTTRAPNITGDFYMDVNVTDQRNNRFIYDNLWGFSTQQFRQNGGTRDLFVSDYTTGQQFPLATGDARFANMYPVESYYLTNGGGQASDPGDPAKILGTSTATTFSNVDIWRTLCRGPISQVILDAYGPNNTQQIDPGETEAGPDGPFTQKSRNVAVSSSYIIWAAPYAGTAFVGPGTITDTTTQARLKSFLDKGGRLFVSGRDVAYALSNNGQADNDFLSSELGAKFLGEMHTDTIKAATIDTSASFVTYGTPEYPATYYDLQIPYHYHPQNQENYGDAALSQNQYGFTDGGPNGAGVVAGIRIDTITPQPGDGATLTTAYTIGDKPGEGPVVGQRIEKTRSGGLKSRAVFFSFGMEAINRRYRVPNPQLPIAALDMRRRVANNLGQYFKTGAISGKAISQNERPIANLLLIVTGPNNSTYLVRTDEKGEYVISGLPQGGYTVDVAWLLDGRLANANTPGAETSPAGFFDSTPAFAPVNGGSTVTDVNVRPIPYSPGSLSGRAVTSKKTPLDFVDDLQISEKAVNLAVLLRSVDPVGTTANSGRYAQIVRTNFEGKFRFTNVPANVDLEVIFNPTVDDIPEESGLRATYKEPRKDVGRRLIPDVRRSAVLQVPISGEYVVNDPDPVKYPDPDAGPTPTGPDADVAADSNVPIVVPEGPSIRGVLTLNGTPVAGIVELLDTKGAPLTPARSRNTAADGTFTFSDVAEGRYRLRGTTTTSDGIVATKDVADVDVVQGVDTVVNIPIVISKISGKVTLNNLPAEGAKIQLLTSAGNVFSPSRTATTDAQGNYTLLNVPNGKYRVRATSGKTSGTVEVTVTDKDVTAPEIVLLNQQVSGVVLLRTDGENPGKPQAGITVELLTEQGASLSPAITTTTDASGNYAFDEVAAGVYTARASYKGDTAISGKFTVTAGQATRGPSLTLALQTLQVKVIDANKKIVVGAAVSIRLTTETRALQSGVTNSSGLFTFKELPAGKYTVTATKTNLGATADITVKRLTKPAQLVLTLSGDITGKSNPTAFNVDGKIYLISLPYENSNGPTTSNVSETTGKVKPATVKVKEAFTVAPLNADGSRNFELQSFDPVGRKFVQLNNDSVLVRGLGYLLKAGKKGTALKIPAGDQNKSLKALTDPAFEKMFTVTLHRNASVFNDPINGRNLIGFGFNPDKFKTVLWKDAQVIHPNGEVAESMQAAVDKGWLKSQFTTLDSTVPGTPATVTATQLKPFGGYYAHTNVDGLKIVLRKPAR